MQTLSYSNGLSHKPGRSVATFALVGSLHLILIYAVLAALDIVPTPTIPTVTTARVIPAKPVHPKPPPPIQTAMQRPENPNPIPVPRIPIDPGTGGPTISGTAGGGAIVAPPEVFVAASALAATHTIPSYPALDRRLNHQGAVLLALAIDAQGNVTGANVVQSSGFEGLDEAAVSWVKTHWRYKPATRNGVAIAASARAEVTFRLTQN
jgi:protein TonB